MESLFYQHKNRERVQQLTFGNNEFVNAKFGEVKNLTNFLTTIFITNIDHKTYQNHKYFRMNFTKFVKNPPTSEICITDAAKVDLSASFVLHRYRVN